MHNENRYVAHRFFDTLSRSALTFTNLRAIVCFNNAIKYVHTPDGKCVSGTYNDGLSLIQKELRSKKAPKFIQRCSPHHKVYQFTGSSSMTNEE